ncbi:ABC transporter, ATP-binding protein [Pseudanabaena sp. lw0831]|uniref:ABC transporter ATP-binding protein/permease n=1 Tax=Pseudanabaena sp. lw0831 TaxID=1357935 RepID=UPI001915B38F|nr:ABC transporter ATP-binding protein/permease [Pseudanabaena sp. lw0831]GBO56395.1 ABC transporter, ATP-binding protein [Pseudanabaena sp. lw0831]
MHLIELQNVSKRFGQKSILQEISLTVRQGEFIVLRGTNGAGKTTLLNVILGLLQPDMGTAMLLGRSPLLPSAKTRVGVVLQKVSPPKNLKVKELIDLVRSYYPDALSTEEILNTVNLAGKHNDWAANLSGGQEQRLLFALALAGKPDLIVLDEPTRNLDLEGYADFWKQLRLCVSQGKTVLMVTNNQADWKELVSLTTRTITLDNGRIHEARHSAIAKPPTTPIPERKQVAMSKGGIPLFYSSSDASLESLAQATSNPPAENSPVLSFGNDSILRGFLPQLWAESLQLLRTPTYAIGILLFSSAIALFPPDERLGMLGVIFFAGLSLLTIAFERTGKRVAVERVEGWLKLLRVTPLHPFAYLSAKVVMSLVMSAMSLLLILGLGAWKLGIDQSLAQRSLEFTSLLLGSIPFTIFGLALGYLVNPKSVDSIAGLAIPIALFTCGLPLPVSQVVQDAIAYSPFYHYGQLVLWSAGLSNDGYFWLHVIWLLWTGCAFVFLANWAYQRDRTME